MQRLQTENVVHLHNDGSSRFHPDLHARSALIQRRQQFDEALDQLAGQSQSIDAIAELIVTSLRAGRTVLVAGNGGSASEAQHLATELVGRFRRERQPWSVHSLTADSAVLTAIANDYGYDTVFERQLDGLGRRDDVFVAFSTSGESENLVRAAELANRKGIHVVALTGADSSRLSALADYALKMPSADTQLTQELHAVMLHILCDIVESTMCRSPLMAVHS